MCGQIIKQKLLAFFLHNFDESHSRTFFYDCFDIDIVVFFANILFQKKCSKKYMPAQIAVSLWECYYKTPVEHIKEGLHTKKNRFMSPSTFYLATSILILTKMMNRELYCSPLFVTALEEQHQKQGNLKRAKLGIKWVWLNSTPHKRFQKSINALNHVCRYVICYVRTHFGKWNTKTPQFISPCMWSNGEK